jgi:hypothetical protein
MARQMCSPCVPALRASGGGPAFITRCKGIDCSLLAWGKSVFGESVHVRLVGKAEKDRALVIARRIPVKASKATAVAEPEGFQVHCSSPGRNYGSFRSIRWCELFLTWLPTLFQDFLVSGDGSLGHSIVVANIAILFAGALFSLLGTLPLGINHFLHVCVCLALLGFRLRW